MAIVLSISNPATIATAANASDVNTPINELKVHLENFLSMVQKSEGVRFTEISAPSNPSSGDYKVYFKSGTNGKLYARNNAGTEVQIFDFAAPVTAVNILQIQVFS